MSKGESRYANVEIDFFTDSKVAHLTDRAKLGYLAWWFIAIWERREVLLPHQSEPSKLAVRTGVSQRAVREGLASGQKTPGKPLLTVFPSGHVRVHGVRRKHANLQNWHDQEDQDFLGQSAQEQPTNSGRTRGTERKGEERKGTEREEPRQDGPLRSLKPDQKQNPNNPHDRWRFLTGKSVNEQDTQFIAELWDNYTDNDLCEAMEQAHARGKALGYVKGILTHKRPGDPQRIGNVISDVISGWTPEQIKAAQAHAQKK